jgi:hypothetical protein
MKCGILIIGSLLWDKETAGRSEWRQSRLSLPEQIPAVAPFRYGRKSQSRGNTFTMTFSSDAAPAQGVVAPCVHQINSLDDLLLEARSLWKAEAPTALAGAIGAGWGCVGAMFQSGRDQHGLETAWAGHLAEAKVQCAPIVGADGWSHLQWPTEQGGAPLDFDIVLFTATKAEANRPTAQEIADAWLAQSAGYEKYFFLNVQHGIRTPDDPGIWERIKSKSAPWLGQASYSAAIKMLESDQS